MPDAEPTLLLTAATIGVLHTALGPDHYLPFIALARARRWSAARTAAVTALCGLAHIGSSVLLGLAGVALGTALFRLESIEATRGTIAAWLMLGFGLAYAAWGVRRALRAGHPHVHVHAHADGTVHAHPHTHAREHVHPHEARSGAAAAWALFVVFAFGPCEPLIPLLMYPAATAGGAAQIALVVAVFAATTLVTMLAAVFGALALTPGRTLARIAPWEHALAGALIALCGAAMQAGF